MTPRLRSSLLLAALGALAACAPDGGPGAGGSPGSKTAFGSSDPGPFSGASDPGSSPSGAAGPFGGGDSGLCEVLCTQLAQCLSISQAQCLSGCASEIEHIPCVAQYTRLFKCAGQFLTCKPPEDKNKKDTKESDDAQYVIDEEGLKQCAAEAKGLSACLEQQGAAGSGGSKQGGGGSGGSGLGGSGLGGSAGFSLGGAAGNAG